ncbi:MAG: N-acetyl-gamma-glutamyl-phosphate reductase [Sediminibacterium sp.]|jgi:N-acetyl-gamma-glutamyl-phosphate reductase|uniref:N-acetyl-gamma-glutamyl-phosphate reductase n=1 Tax=Sediminibacterium sp. TaxID=1917865 RepID=UPI003F704D20
MSQIRAAIIGGAGYTGGEMIRLLLRHSAVDLLSVHSSSNAGKPLYEVHKDLIGETELLFADQPFTEVDVLFLCVGHGDAKKFLEQNHISDAVKIIDLSQDFRLTSGSIFGNRNFVYGLPELNRELIKTAHNIANPGCFATAIQLALLPLAKAGILSDVHTTGITGSTGAGQSLSTTSHFSWRANNIQAYKSLNHQHIQEITASINQLQKDSPLSALGEGPGIHFVPWRGDFTRGIYTSSIIDCSFPLEKVKELYREYYQKQSFTFLSETMIDLKQVVNTNKCLLHIEKQGNKLIVHSAIDNLLKGASGQAVQNMNLMLGLDEKTGLNLKANYF